ncbi:MAG: hypothetical protein JXM70_16850, partial [Pirellulales bacterium]|nr:hypothetical protein [Pirellulales bacterium]
MNLLFAPDGAWGIRVAGIRRKILGGFALLTLLFALAGVVLHMTLRDRIHGLSILHYAMPPLMIAGLLFVSSTLLWLAKRRRWAISILLLGCSAIAWGLIRDGFSHDSPPPAGHDLRVFFWNTARGIGGWDDIAHVIVEHDPDLIALVEVTGPDSDRLDFWREKFPGYSLSQIRYATLLMVKGTLTPGPYGYLATGSKYRVFNIETPDGRRFNVLLFDIDSDLHHCRRYPLTT